MANQSRLKKDIETLRHISEPCNGGVTRIGLTATYRQGVEYLKQQMQEIGLTIKEDDVGNVYGILLGKDPALPSIVSGSHLDTVRNSGAFDGIAGVVCALEAVRMLKENNIQLSHSVEVLATVEEEGTHFGTVLLGSRFISGEFSEQDKDRLYNDRGNSLREVLTDYLGHRVVQPAFRAPESIKAFLELHDEQGPVLEATNIDIGIVDSIVAIQQMVITITGFAGHAGTVPMTLRQDAGVAGCLFVTELNRFILRQYADSATLTVGKFSLQPNSANCIPNQCQFTLDIRSGDAKILEDIDRYIHQQALLIQQECNTAFDINNISYKSPVVMNEALRQLIIHSCEKLNLSYRHMNSGAGHDAMIMAGVCPSAMLFVPCYKGITHHPDENVTWENMAKGTEVLFHTMIALDQS